MTLEDYDDQYRCLAGIVGAGRRSTVALHLGARFCSLKMFEHAVIAPPANMCWWFLFLHQLVLEDVGVKFPSRCGFGQLGKQRVKEAVNDDLRRLCEIAVNKQPITKKYLKGLKV